MTHPLPKVSQIDTDPRVPLTAVSVEKCKQIYAATGLKSELVWYRWETCPWQLAYERELFIYRGEISPGTVTVPAYTASMIALELVKRDTPMVIPLHLFSADDFNIDDYMADLLLDIL